MAEQAARGNGCQRTTDDSPSYRRTAIRA